MFHLWEKTLNYQKVRLSHINFYLKGPYFEKLLTKSVRKNQGQFAQEAGNFFFQFEPITTTKPQQQQRTSSPNNTKGWEREKEKEKEEEKEKDMAPQVVVVQVVNQKENNALQPQQPSEEAMEWQEQA